MHHEKPFDVENNSSEGAGFERAPSSSPSSNLSCDHVPLYDNDGKVNLIPMPTSDPKGREKKIPYQKIKC
jgi:hypothetical protein